MKLILDIPTDNERREIFEALIPLKGALNGVPAYFPLIGARGKSVNILQEYAWKN